MIDGIDSVLHPDATVTKRNLVDVANQIEGVIAEISKVLSPDATVKRNLVDVANQIEGVIAEISKVLSPDAKRNLVDIANQIEGVIGEISKILEPTAKRGVITDLANSLQVRGSKPLLVVFGTF